MRNALLIIALLATACSKKEAPTGAATQGTTKTPAANAEDIDKKFGGACAKFFDCPKVDIGSTCTVECVKAPEAAEGYCQLRRTVTEAGQPCRGNYDGFASMGSSPKEKLPVYGFCDLRANLFCNASFTCEATKPAGAACKEHAECGIDGACSQDTCVAAGTAGSVAVKGRCGGQSRRQKTEQCEARAADGAACKYSDDCASGNCVHDGSGGTCKPAKTTTCTLRASA